uniref:Uncharacterized protein n=1 Tax=Vitis vinifera TaxID=29760 RepID=F6H3X0_VITVI
MFLAINCALGWLFTEIEGSNGLSDEGKVFVLLPHHNAGHVKISQSLNFPTGESRVKLKYDGFERVENVDPMALAKTGGECLVKSSLPLE